ncbi:MAG: stage III sporulation protein AB [Clostridiales bacterium]|nr:stage III sporulation protein AB [Candidatus Equinaster intestinalis]
MSVLLKFAGTVLIIFCSTAIGFIRSNKYTGRVNDLKWYLSAIESVAQKIKFGMPNTADTVKSIFGYEKYYSVSLPFEIKLKKSYLSKPEEALINEFFGELGSFDAETEVKRAKRYSAEIEMRLAAAEEKQKENGRLCKLLGLFSGIAISVVLI